MSYIQNKDELFTSLFLKQKKNYKINPSGTKKETLKVYLADVTDNHSKALGTSNNTLNTARKVKFPGKDFFSKYEQISSFLRNCSHLPKKSLI